MVDAGIQPWLFEVEPLEGESLSHYLGRFRRQNHLMPGGLGTMASIGAVVARWEKFHLNPYPTQAQFEALGKVLGLSTERLWGMLPSQGEGMQCAPIRLCGACYGEDPCHRIEWQYKSVWKCDRHNLKLLTKCPNCEAKFKVPALWECNYCSRCQLSFSQMKEFQRIG
ncbi:TniQ family protein [Nodosilinea sp. FACHB-131]|uniref:TniQ family protein n=1 Tax=Cyanophyceae TaxID=3028117 RepID=UPI00168A0901|nr:TniQ family protein [Nodosilinea sp. FACHB-131]MBD1875015.1 TniQ family protein [Nodosilinea sp. FACHB-131]